MAKSTCTFRKSDVARLLSAAERAGVKVARVEVEGGELTLVPDYREKPAIQEPNDATPNEWDSVK